MAKLKIKEKDVRDAVIAFAKEYVGPGHKRNVFRQGLSSGWPDDTFYFPSGVTLHIEFKAPGKLPSRLQEEKIGLLRDAGHLVLIIDNEQEGKAAFHLLDNPEVLLSVMQHEFRSEMLENMVATRCGRPNRALVAACRRIPT